MYVEKLRWFCFNRISGKLSSCQVLFDRTIYRSHARDN